MNIDATARRAGLGDFKWFEVTTNLESRRFRYTGIRFMNSNKSIALLVKTSSQWHRDVLLGVGQYAEDHGGWDFTVPPADKNGEVQLPDRWRGEGIIYRATSPNMVSAIQRTGIPAINVSWLKHGENCPSVQSDEAACARMAVHFLLEKQFDHIGYVPFPSWLEYSDTTETTLRAELQARGKGPLHQFDSSRLVFPGTRTEDFLDWLNELPKPIAIVVWSSELGNVITKVCKQCRINVPRSVSVLCVEHDSLWSALAPVPLSNIDQDPWRVGYSAASVLHRMIKGGPAPEVPVRIPPISVVQRLSTEASAVKDEVLGQALKLIYENAKQGITVKEVVSKLGISRRALESKFKQNLDCSPGIYIRRTQLTQVARLLRTTKLSITEIADRTGFVYPEVLMRSFKREYGLTPMQFRGAGSPASASRD